MSASQCKRIRVVKSGLPCQWPPPRVPEPGEVFRSMAWAECSTGINRTHISAQIRGRVKHARGVVFEYVEG